MIQRHISYVAKRLSTLNLLNTICDPLAEILLTEYVGILSNNNINTTDMLKSVSNKLNGLCTHYVY